MLRLALSTEREKRSILSVLRTFKSQKKRMNEKGLAKLDTTDYLLSNPVDRNGLLKAMDDFENNRSIFIQRDLIEL